jgi:metal-responsive CopG/Arc/MetJ family transcriptional regulator
MSDEYDLIHMKVDKPLLDAVDDYRREQPEIPSRAEAIRQLMRRALNARGKCKPFASP